MGALLTVWRHLTGTVYVPQCAVPTLAAAFLEEFTMAGYRTGALASSKGVYVGLARLPWRN